MMLIKRRCLQVRFFCVSGMREDAEGCAGRDADAGFGRMVRGTKGSTREKTAQVSQTHLPLVILFHFVSQQKHFYCP